VSTPLFILNAGFFDPKAQQTTAYLTHAGRLAGDPRQTPSLTGNPTLKPYLSAIFNRPEFRVYQCKGLFHPETRYDITAHDHPSPKDCTIQEAVGGGPTLLPEYPAQEEAFIDVNATGRRIRDPIGVDARNARTAIGLTQTGDVILLLAAQNPGHPEHSGFSLPDLRRILKEKGAVKAMNLDGGSSSSLMYDGRVIWGKYHADGTPVIRPVKSVLMVLPPTTPCPTPQAKPRQ